MGSKSEPGEIKTPESAHYSSDISIPRSESLSFNPTIHVAECDAQQDLDDRDSLSLTLQVEDSEDETETIIAMQTSPPVTQGVLYRSSKAIQVDEGSKEIHENQFIPQGQPLHSTPLSTLPPPRLHSQELPLAFQNQDQDPNSDLPASPGIHNDGKEASQKYDSILATLKSMNAKLLKLDTLETITSSLQEEVARSNSKMEEMSSRIGSINTELANYVQQWQEVSASPSNRVTKLEKSSKSWENKLELSRTSMDKGLKTIQSGVDSNSKKALEFENFLKASEKKWRSLHSLENTMKKAADKKFQDLKGLITTEVRKEILNEMKSDAPKIIPPEVLETLKSDLKKEILEEIKASKSPVIAPDDLKVLREEILQSDQTKQVTLEDLNKLRDEVLGHVNSHGKHLRNECRSLNNTPPEEENHKKLKDQAFAKRFNIIIFGIQDSHSDEEDLNKAHSFFSEKMGLMGLNIRTTYRLGSLIKDSPYPRPLVVKFANIGDRWLVWNNKGKIPYNKESPIRIQEDIPRKLCEEARILQRIAKVANMNSHTFGEVKVKNYKLLFRGEWYGINDIELLPPELHP